MKKYINRVQIFVCVFVVFIPHYFFYFHLTAIKSFRYLFRRTIHLWQQNIPLFLRSSTGKSHWGHIWRIRCLRRTNLCLSYFPGLVTHRIKVQVTFIIFYANSFESRLVVQPGVVELSLRDLQAQ